MTLDSFEPAGTSAGVTQRPSFGDLNITSVAILGVGVIVIVVITWMPFCTRVAITCLGKFHRYISRNIDSSFKPPRFQSFSLPLQLFHVKS